MSSNLFGMKKPCDNCPFTRKESRVALHSRRIREIHGVVTGSTGGVFPCHKTVDYSEYDDPSDTPLPSKSQSFCAGAVIYALKQDSPNQMMRIGMRLRDLDPQQMLKHQDLVFDGIHEWMKHSIDGPPQSIEQNADVETCNVSGSNCEAPAGYIEDGEVIFGTESADYECYFCGQSVCGSCSRRSGDDIWCEDCIEGGDADDIEFDDED